jgi:hypothetical protein
MTSYILSFLVASSLFIRLPYTWSRGRFLVKLTLRVYILKNTTPPPPSRKEGRKFSLCYLGESMKWDRQKVENLREKKDKGKEKGRIGDRKRENGK